MSAAIRLAALQRQKGGEPLAVAVLEKSRQSGSHMLSGAVLDPSGLDALLPDWKERGAPVETPVRQDRIYYLTASSQLRAPITPPPLRNHGNYVISLNRFVRWLGEQAEAEGIDIFTGFAGTDVLYRGRPRGRGPDRRPRRRQAGPAEGRLRARRRHQGCRHHLRRRGSGQSHQGPRQPAGARRRGARRPTPSASRSSGRFHRIGRRRAPSSTRWAIPSGARSSAAGSSTCCRRAAWRSGSWWGSTTGTRYSIRTWRFSGSSSIPSSPACWPAAR